MERPEGFENSFSKTALQAEIEQHDANIASITGVLNGEREALRGLQIARSQEMRGQTVNADRVAGITREMEAKEASIANLAGAVDKLRALQARNRTYIDYIIHLEGNGKRRA